MDPNERTDRLTQNEIDRYKRMIAIAQPSLGQALRAMDAIEDSKEYDLMPMHRSNAIMFLRATLDILNLL